MSESREIRIVCDRADRHPKHPKSVVIAFRPGLAAGWSVSLSRGHGTGPGNGNIERFLEVAKRANGDCMTLRGDERVGVTPLLVEALLGRAKPTQAEIEAASAEYSRECRTVYHLECKRCHQSTQDAIREEKLWEVLDWLRRADKDEVTLKEMGTILQALARVAD